MRHAKPAGSSQRRYSRQPPQATATRQIRSPTCDPAPESTGALEFHDQSSVERLAAPATELILSPVAVPVDDGSRTAPLKRSRRAAPASTRMEATAAWHGKRQQRSSVGARRRTAAHVGDAPSSSSVTCHPHMTGLPGLAVLLHRDADHEPVRGCAVPVVLPWADTAEAGTRVATVNKGRRRQQRARGQRHTARTTASAS
jgi:hypothetical protein